MTEPFKIVACGDVHIDWVTSGLSRFDEIEESVHRVADAAIEEGADLFAFLGDWADPDRGSAILRCTKVLLDVALKLHSRGIAMLAIAGNHCVSADEFGTTSITPLRALESLPDSTIYVAEEPAAIDIVKGGRTVSLLALPFTSPVRAYDVEAALRSLSDGRRREDTVVFSHLSLPGLESDEAITEMSRGREVILPEALAHEKAALVLQGHYHRRQRTELGTWIPGSLARLTFAPGIDEHRPGYLVCEL